MCTSAKDRATAVWQLRKEEPLKTLYDRKSSYDRHGEGQDWTDAEWGDVGRAEVKKDWTLKRRRKHSDSGFTNDENDAPDETMYPGLLDTQAYKTLATENPDLVSNNWPELFLDRNDNGN